MRHYETKLKECQLYMRATCNACGQEIRNEVTSIAKRWGYHSSKDGELQCIDVCEACWDRWVATFVLPPSADRDHERESRS
jgi:hypothetical protein